MARKEWAIDLEGRSYAVAFERGSWSGKEVVTVDGVAVARKGMPLWGKVADKDLPFTIAGHECYIHTTLRGLDYAHELVVGGRSAETGKNLGGYAPLPAWAWFFIFACGLIAKAGGLLGVPFGLGGAFACQKIARNPEDSAGMRAALCGAVTFTCWAAYALVAVIVVGAVGILGW